MLLAEKVGPPVGGASHRPSLDQTTPMATKIMKFQQPPAPPRTPPRTVTGNVGDGVGSRGPREHSFSPLESHKGNRCNKEGIASSEDDASDAAGDDASSMTLAKHHQLQHRLRKDKLREASVAQTPEERQDGARSAARQSPRRPEQGSSSYSGLLQKKGGLLKTSWQERLFHLQGTTLRWSEPGERDAAAACKGTAVVRAVKLVGEDIHVDAVHAKKGAVTYVLRAPGQAPGRSGADRAEAWRSRMELAIAKAAAPGGEGETGA